MEKILVLDFGGQTCQLIARRLRDRGYFSEVLPGDSVYNAELAAGLKGVILSGSPYSVYEEDAPSLDKGFYESGHPLLGICYGFQSIVNDHGGKVNSLEKREYGRSAIEYTIASPLFTDVPEGFNSWMSHGDSIEELPEGFTLIASSDHHIAAAKHDTRDIFGIQFHPEVSHCEYGELILENFARDICGMQKNWSMEQYLEQETIRLREQVGSQNVLLLISGGVDSTVLGGLLLRALDPKQVYLMYIDTGLMRKAESVEVERYLQSLGAHHLHIIHAEERFLKPLKGVSDPEEKRKIIGDTFIQVQEQEIENLDLGDYLLAQGTLYTDLIESGLGVGKKAQVIKTHHNVRSPLVAAKREAGKIIEPFGRIYKDEVRKLGTNLGIGHEIIRRHPFPGPGLGVRIIGEVDSEKCRILREADAIFISELKSRNLYDAIWQAFCVLLPVRTVGVAGDAREYGFVLSLRAITSIDGMTADVYPFDMKDLLEISNNITNSVPEIGRVVYDISSKPPATIEWE
jgi:GMP synthase (glutamine-hydrolysing)